MLTVVEKVMPGEWLQNGRSETHFKPGTTIFFAIAPQGTGNLANIRVLGRVGEQGQFKKCHATRDSTSRATAKTTLSRNDPDAICTPTGNPARVRPTGTLIAG